MTKRLYVVVRNDISPGLQIAQACHAVREFTLHSSEDVGDNLVVLQAPALALDELCMRADAANVLVWPFHEPDLNGELTAAAFGLGAQRLLGSLPLALKS